jgi:hypothetical protein
MWYRPEGADTPETIAANIMAIVRSGVESSPLDARVRSAAVARR